MGDNGAMYRDCPYQCKPKSPMDCLLIVFIKLAILLLYKFIYKRIASDDICGIVFFVIFLSIDFTYREESTDDYIGFEIEELIYCAS